jgi:hypothetical protein
MTATTIKVQNGKMQSVEGLHDDLVWLDGRTALQLATGPELKFEGSLRLEVSADRQLVLVQGNKSPREEFGLCYPLLLFLGTALAVIQQLRWVVLACLSLGFVWWLPDGALCATGGLLQALCVMLCATTWVLAVWIVALP